VCESRASCERKCGLAADTGREPVLRSRWRAVRCPFLSQPFPPSPSHDGTRHTGSAQQSTHRQMPVRLLRYSTRCAFMAAALDGPNEPHHFAHEIARACIHAHAAGPFASRTTVPLFLRSIVFSHGRPLRAAYPCTIRGWLPHRVPKRDLYCTAAARRGDGAESSAGPLVDAYTAATEASSQRRQAVACAIGFDGCGCCMDNSGTPPCHRGVQGARRCPIFTGTGLPLPYLQRDRAHPRYICSEGCCSSLATSAPGLAQDGASRKLRATPATKQPTVAPVETRSPFPQSLSRLGRAKARSVPVREG
jgi:hypothetical protein